MTQRPNAITHTREHRSRGGTVYIYYFQSFYEAKPSAPWRKILATPLNGTHRSERHYLRALLTNNNEQLLCIEFMKNVRFWFCCNACECLALDKPAAKNKRSYLPMQNFKTYFSPINYFHYLYYSTKNLSMCKMSECLYTIPGLFTSVNTATMEIMENPLENQKSETTYF